MFGVVLLIFLNQIKDICISFSTTKPGIKWKQVQAGTIRVCSVILNFGIIY